MGWFDECVDGPMVVTVPVYNGGTACDWRCSFNENIGRASITCSCMWIVLYLDYSLISVSCVVITAATALSSGQCWRPASQQYHSSGKRWEFVGVGVGGRHFAGTRVKRSAEENERFVFSRAVLCSYTQSFTCFRHYNKRYV